MYTPGAGTPVVPRDHLPRQPGVDTNFQTSGYLRLRFWCLSVFDLHTGSVSRFCDLSGSGYGTSFRGGTASPWVGRTSSRERTESTGFRGDPRGVLPVQPTLVFEESLVRGISSRPSSEAFLVGARFPLRDKLHPFESGPGSPRVLRLGSEGGLSTDLSGKTRGHDLCTSPDRKRTRVYSPLNPCVGTQGPSGTCFVPIGLSCWPY